MERVLPDSPFARTGIVPGDAIITINGYDSRDLYRLGRRSSSEYLRTVPTIFRANDRLTVVTARGLSVSTILNPRPFLYRLASANRPVLSNILFGATLLVIGTAFTLRSFVLRSTEQNGTVSFFSFTTLGAITITLSYFHSLWGTGVLISWSIVLEAGACAAIVALIQFALHFPYSVTRGRRIVSGIMVIPPLVRAVFLATGHADPLRPGHMFVHLCAGVGIAVFTAIEVVRYRRSAAGSRRRIRWIFLGAFASIPPYLAYLLIKIFGRSFTEFGNAGLFNQIVAFILLLFPISVGSGLVHVKNLDVDRLIAQSVQYAVLGAIVSFVVVLFAALSVNTLPALMPILVILSVTFFGPAFFSSIERMTQRFVLRRFERFRHAAEDAGDRAEQCGDTTELFVAAHSFLETNYQPEYLHLCRVGGPGEPLLEFQPNESRWAPSVATTFPEVYRSCSRLDEHRLLLRIRNPASHDHYELLMGPRRNDDIYVESDILILRRLIDRLEQRLPALLYLEQLRAKITELEQSPADRTDLLQEVRHRVNNNLQVMASLIWLREQEIEDEETVQHQFRIVRDQIDAMALLYENVYNNGLVQTINMAQYLRQIVQRIESNGHYAGTDVTVRSAAVSAIVPPWIALPCGLLTVGFVSPILLNTEDPRDPAEIDIRFVLEDRIETSSQALLEIEYNGPPLSSTRINSDLFRVTAAQLGGSINHTAGSPNRVSIRFTPHHDVSAPPGDPPGVLAR